MNKSESGSQKKLSRLKATLLQRIREVKFSLEMSKLPFVSSFLNLTFI